MSETTSTDSPWLDVQPAATRRADIEWMTFEELFVGYSFHGSPSSSLPAGSLLSRKLVARLLTSDSDHRYPR